MTRIARLAGLMLLIAPAAGPAANPAPAGADKLTFHNDAARTGWNSTERELNPATVAGPGFGPLWQSPQLDGFRDVPARLYASPLYVADVALTEGSQAGRRLALVYAVTSTGYVYAINASASGSPAPGTIVWRVRLTEKPCEGGTSGNLSTPVIDRAANRIYVTSCDDDRKWQVHALDIRSGKSRPGWPIAIGEVALNRPGMNRNGINRFTDKRSVIQRGALNLSADKARLYVAIGPDSTGWIVAIDTARAAVATAFSSTAKTEEDQGGMWASAGPSVDGEGRVYIATGSKFLARDRKGVAGIFPDSAHNWGQSVLQFRDDRQAGFVLTGTYSPFNYCQAGSADIDLGSSGTVAIDLPGAATGTPALLTVAGKQGNIYLLDRAHLPGGIERRPACSTDPFADGSLLAPEPQPQFGMRGPVNLFGPYSDYVSMLDQAKSRSTPAYFNDGAGNAFLFATGSAKTGKDFATSTPPGLARVRVVTAPGQAAFLRVDGLEETQVFQNPGSPVVSSNGGAGAIVWVLDMNAPRSAPLYGEQAPKPVLYAFDALSLKLLWKNAVGELYTSGKYNEPAVVDGLVLVGTDRIQAFGLGAPGTASVRRDPSPTAPLAAAARPAPAAKPMVSADPVITGRGIYRARCVACHGAGQPGTPSRAQLAAMPRLRIVEALLTGVMTPMASGLSKSDVDAVALFLTERK